MADIDPVLVEQVFDIVQRQRKANVHHDRELDTLGKYLEIAEGEFVILRG